MTVYKIYPYASILMYLKILKVYINTYIYGFKSTFIKIIYLSQKPGVVEYSTEEEFIHTRIHN